MFAFFFEGFGDLKLLEEEGFKGGLVEEEGAFVFALGGVGSADLCNLMEGEVGIGEFFAQDLKAADQGLVGALFGGDGEESDGELS